MLDWEFTRALKYWISSYDSGTDGLRKNFMAERSIDFWVFVSLISLLCSISLTRAATDPPETVGGPVLLILLLLLLLFKWSSILILFATDRLQKTSPSSLGAEWTSAWQTVLGLVWDKDDKFWHRETPELLMLSSNWLIRLERVLLFNFRWQVSSIFNSSSSFLFVFFSTLVFCWNSLIAIFLPVSWSLWTGISSSTSSPSESCSSIVGHLPSWFEWIECLRSPTE